jgi:hypothetical protein
MAGNQSGRRVAILKPEYLPRARAGGPVGRSGFFG